MAFGPLMISISGTKLTLNERKLLVNPKVGGLILFKENITSKQQLLLLISELMDLNPELLISIDQEGGLVKRIKFTDFPILPAPINYIKQEQYSFTEAIQLYTNDLVITNSLLADLGIHINFAPVLDSLHPHCPVIGALNRAIANLPQDILIAAKIIAPQVKANKFPMVGKHFIDHGFTKLDSHLTLPTDPRSKIELKPHLDLYRELIALDLMDIIMPGHVIYPAFDNRPATMSTIILTDILRGDLNYQNAIIGDCFSMQALAKTPLLDNINTGIIAGLDMVIVSHQPAEVMLRLLPNLLDNTTAAKQRLKRLWGKRLLKTDGNETTIDESTLADGNIKLVSGKNTSVLN